MVSRNRCTDADCTHFGERVPDHHLHTLYVPSEPALRATVQQRGRSITRVTVMGANVNTSWEDIFRTAMAAANESRSSLFGWDAHVMDDGSISVSLHTD